MEIIHEKTVALVGNHTAEIQSGRNDANLLNVLFTETYLAIASHYKQGFRTFLSGMSEGFETIAAEAVLQFKKERKDIQLVVVQNDNLLSSSSQLLCYYTDGDKDIQSIYSRAEKQGIPTVNLYDSLTGYFDNDCLVKQLLQPFNHIDGFSYCKEGVMLSYLYGEEPIIVGFEQIEYVESNGKKLYLTLTNGLTVEASLFS